MATWVLADPPYCLSAQRQFLKNPLQPYPQSGKVDTLEVYLTADATHETTMHVEGPSTNELIQNASQGQADAAEQLFERYRARLRHMVTLRMDPRVRARIDPSDVVQETLIVANRKLDEYFGTSPDSVLCLVTSNCC